MLYLSLSSRENLRSRGMMVEQGSCIRSLAILCLFFLVLRLNAQETDGFLSINTTSSISHQETLVGSLSINQQNNAAALLITHIVLQKLAGGINSWSFLSFVEVGENRYILCIVVSGSITQAQGEIVWAANRGEPVSNNGVLELQSDGNLVLSDSKDGSVASRRSIWSSNTTQKGVTGMNIFGSGLLEILNNTNHPVWRSWDHPTDTILLGQVLKAGDTLVSRSSRFNLSEGIYSLVVKPGGIGLYVKGSNGTAPELYWMWSVYSTNNTFGLDHNCADNPYTVSIQWPDSRLGLMFNITNKSAENMGIASNLCDVSSLRQHLFLSYVDESKAQHNSSSDAVFIRLDYDGNLRGYASGLTEPFQRLSQAMHNCQLPRFCGSYGICLQYMGNSSCECPGNRTHHLIKNSNGDCVLSQSPSCENTKGSWQMLSLTGFEYYRNQYSVPLNMSAKENCSEYCFGNCSCMASFYLAETKACFIVSSPLGTIEETSNMNHFAFLKVQSTDLVQTSKDSKKSSNSYKVIIGVSVGVLVAAVIVIYLYPFKACRKTHGHESSSRSEEHPDRVVNSIPDLMARKFSYKEIQTITKSFGKVLGSGGFGTVYEGVFADGRKVAVKRLEIARQGEKEFYSEVAILGIIHHWNLVQLLGFCAQGSHKLLIYDHMSNGSLDQWLFNESKKRFLTWPIRFNIILGTARGLTYLHQECRYKIIHLDVKPQNILLDENFVAKVSDFGMATLMNRKESRVVTTMRGTPGYLAPEWLLECAITEKSDVYSFGMVLLEIIGGRKNYNMKADDSDKYYFPAWALSMAAAGTVSEVIDPQLEDDIQRKEAMRVLKIGFLCIQENANRRPSMGTVVQMLEGEREVPDTPLNQTFQFAIAKKVSPHSSLSSRSSSSYGGYSSTVQVVGTMSLPRNGSVTTSNVGGQFVILT
eukprot:Gb_38844 [translate_table: standard]